MRIYIYFLLLASIAIPSIAKSEVQLSEFVGQGRIKSEPDYIALDITVYSQCYVSPEDAQLATDEAVRGIDDYLQTLKPKDDQHFKIIISGGYTSSYSRWNNNRELCQNTFQKVTTISLKIAATKSFEKTFAKLQTHALRYFTKEQPLSDVENPITFVQLGAPEPRITLEHQDKLQLEALKLATSDAINKYKAAIQSCPSVPWKIVKISENDSGYMPPMPLQYAKFSMRESADAAGSVSAPIRFDDIRVEKSVRVAFEADGPLCYTPSL